MLPDDVEIASENQEADTQIDEVDIKPCFDEKVEDLYFKYLRGKFCLLIRKFAANFSKGLFQFRGANVISNARWFIGFYEHKKNFQNQQR